MTSILDRFNLSGRSVFVTGGASGIGLAYVEAAAEAGAAVTIVDIDEAGAIREADRLTGQGYRVRADKVDVAREDEVIATLDAHRAAFGGPDVVFANVGIADGKPYLAVDGSRIPGGQIDELPSAAWRRTLDVNLSGTFYTIQNAVRLMKADKRRGSIIVTSSNASFITVPIVPSPYMATKAGITHMVRQFARELAPFGIRINAIAPGSIVTNIGGGHLKDPVQRAVWDKGVPLGRMAEPDQIKPLALYLASDASDYVTGTEIVFDGGVSLVGFPG